MVAVLWAAAFYRISLSIRTETTAWRTAFTACITAVAVGSTTSVFGDQSIDAWSGAWNLALLLTRLALTGAAVAASIYVFTLKQKVVSVALIRRRLTGGAVLGAAQIAAWAAAPIHDRELLTTAQVNESSSFGSIFALAFAIPVVAVTAEVAFFCLSKAASRVDVTRTISLLLTGSACVAGAILFSLGSIGVLLHQFVGRETAAISAFMDRAVPLVAVVLALGTLSLLLAPPVVDLVQSYLRWRWLRPLWQHLVRLRPEVHLDVPATGGPLARVHFRLHRCIVEIHDALRVTPVSVPPAAGVDELATALHRLGGPRMAGEVLAQTRTAATDDSAQLLALARCYSRSRSWSR